MAFGAREASERDDGAAPGYLDDALWSRLGAAASREAFAAAWLELQCRFIDGVEAAVVVLGAPERGPFVPVAGWPDGRAAGSELSAVSELALTERRGVVRAARHPATAGSLDSLAFPIVVDEQLCGVVALSVASRPDVELRAVMRQLQWGATGLEVLVWRRGFTTRQQLAGVVEFVALCLEHDRFRGAATAVVTELATRLSCDRVSIGFRRGRHTRVDALSHSADFADKSNLMRAIGAAMDEAVDQHEAVIHPPPDADAVQLTRAHAELARQHGAGTVCTIPLGAGGEILGALTLERPLSAPFDAATVALCRHIAAVVGPVLDGKRRDDRWLVHKAWDSAGAGVAKLFGRGHPGLKLSATAVLAVVVFLALVDGTYRVSADATLEGTVQRVVTAPINGYVAQAPFRAGDRVSRGDVLATLDDRDLRLEQTRWSSQRQQKLQEYKQALAAHDSAKVRILAAQVEQADAQLELLREQLARAQLVAPFDGIVVSGDLSQSLGAPVERGQTLFEVAPLDAYRIILEVDEREISQLAAGQRGQLALAGLPGTLLPMVVEKITPVSSSREGRNYFRAEAMLEQPADALRPGMEGVGKVDIGERRLIWIWTHKLVAWVRLWLWSWWR